MPCKSSESYSVSYHPSIEEYTETKTRFIENFEKQFKEDKYILVPEKGKQTYSNHFQIWIGFEKEKRADSFRRSFHTMVMKNIEVSYLKTALRISPITRDVKLCKGYTLKELELGGFDSVISNLSDSVLLDCQKYYKQHQENKSVQGDRTRINKNNIKHIFLKYFKMKHKKVPLIDIDRLKIIETLAEMDDNGYWLGSIVTGRELSRIIDYLHHSVNNKTAEYYCKRDLECQDLDKSQIERARQQ